MTMVILPPPQTRPDPGLVLTSPVTFLERAVLDRLAMGLTVPEIAEAMFLSEVTVRAHLGSVFTKLGLRTRSRLAAHVLALADLD